MLGGSLPEGGAENDVDAGAGGGDSSEDGMKRFSSLMLGAMNAAVMIMAIVLALPVLVLVAGLCLVCVARSHGGISPKGGVQ